MCSRKLATGLLAILGMLLLAATPRSGMSADGVMLAAKADAEAGKYAEGGAKSCMKCHDEQPVTLILQTPHALRADKRTPFASHDCETCHGASPEHMVKPPEGKKRALPKIVFGRKSPTSAAEQNKVCLECHKGGLRINWAGSQHASEDVPCASCHNVHSLKDRMLVKTEQADTCFTCHVSQKVQSRRLSRHPIKEGKVICSDCHNPHGAFGPKLLVKNTVNETCFQCHAEKRGPFLWEHAPVSEDCSNCHTPHGSTQPRLLKVRTPFLCQTCHSEAFHPSTLYSGTGLPSASPGSRLLAKGCLNCHPKVHGTNHPSGPRLTR
jgi:DmsE family decaheme c-type cytochrome